MRDFQTYYSRLRTATPREVCYRLRKGWLAHRLRNTHAHPSASAAVLASAKRSLANLALPPFTGQVHPENISQILNGKLYTLHASTAAVDRFNGRHAGCYFKVVGLRQSDPDLRAVWEAARLQHLTLLLAHLVEHPTDVTARSIRTFVRDALDTWLQQNPFLRGPAYMSAMECGLRVPVFFYALKLLRADNKWHDTLLQAMYQHAWWIYRNLSLFASAGNHTVCECVGLVFSGAVYKHTRDGCKWLDRGFELLGKEISHQILPDGGAAEQSLSYHRFVADLYWLAIGFLQVNDLREVGFLKSKLHTAERFPPSVRIVVTCTGQAEGAL